jgi:hypothetical protein
VSAQLKIAIVEKACVFKLKDNPLVRQILLEEIYFAGDVQKHCPKVSTP